MVVSDSSSTMSAGHKKLSRRVVHGCGEKQKRRSRRTARTILVVAVCLEEVCQRYLPSIGFGFDSFLVHTVDGITYRIKITGFTDGKVIVD